MLLLLSAAPRTARALRFDLESGHTKCISDEIKVNSMVVGKYHVVGPDPNFPDNPLPDSHRISLRVSDDEQPRIDLAKQPWRWRRGFLGGD